MHKNMETNVFVFSMSDTKTVVLIKKHILKTQCILKYTLNVDNYSSE